MRSDDFGWGPPDPKTGKYYVPIHPRMAEGLRGKPVKCTACHTIVPEKDFDATYGKFGRCRACSNDWPR